MMNNEQALEVTIGNKVECYAMVGGLYVSNVSITYDKVSLAKDYKDAMDVCGLDYTEWLVNNIEGIQFFKIQTQAQSVPITVEEILGE